MFFATADAIIKEEMLAFRVRLRVFVYLFRYLQYAHGNMHLLCFFQANRISCSSSATISVL